MPLPDDGAFFDDIDGDMAEQEAITVALEAQRKPITTEGCTCPDGPKRCRFLPLIEFANRIGWPDLDSWMFMGADATDSTTLSHYKHRDTRRYLHLDAAGDPYVGGRPIGVGPATYHPYERITDIRALRLVDVDCMGNVTF
jgi:hypothetical protein